MDTSTHRHRHFVALPVFLLVLGVSFAGGNGNMSYMVSRVASPFSAAEVPTLPGHVYGEVLDGDLQTRDGLALLSGVVRLGSLSHMSLSIDSLSATVFDGGLYASKTQDSVTIAAITSPVFITHGDQRMIIPIGMQWSFTGDSLTPLAAGFTDWMHSRTLSPLPSHFFEEQISALRLAEGNHEEKLPVARLHLPADSVSVDTFLLPVSLALKQGAREEHVLGVARTAIENNDIASLTELLRNPEVSRALQSPRGRTMQSILLSQRELRTAMRMELLLQLVDTEALWALTSFHPEYRDIAWSFTGPDVSVESQLAHAFLFPFSLFSTEEVSDFVLDRYRMTLLGLAQSIGDISLFIESILDAHLTLIDRLEAKGYPRRAEQLSHALTALIDSVELQTEVMMSALEHLRTKSSVDIAPLPQKSEGEDDLLQPESVAPEVIYTPSDVEAMAQALLQDSGALFTTQTGIAAYADNKARVSEIYFTTPSEDRKATFTLDVYTTIVSEIEINGQSNFPYEPSFEGFVEWISQ